MTQLAPCPTCSRHVRRDEGACPFCETTLPASFARPVARPRPPRAVGRAVAFAFGVGAATVATGGCADTEEAVQDAGPPDAGPPDADTPDGSTPDSGSIPIYAAAPTEDVGRRMASAGDGPEPSGDA
jgi:hypothetical protein